MYTLVDEFVGLADEARETRLSRSVLMAATSSALMEQGTPPTKVIGMRVFAAEDCVDFDDFFLPLESVEIMSDGDEIDFGGEFVCRMAQPPLAKMPRPLTANTLILILYSREIRSGVLVPF